MQYRCINNQRLAFVGDFPTLGLAARVFGTNVVLGWISIQLRDLSEFAGCKDKLNNFQLQNIAYVILANWKRLRVTALLYFFMQFKTGRYGKFYGSVDALTITNALREFEVEYDEAVNQYVEEEESRRKAVEEAQSARAAKEFSDARAVCNMGIMEWYKLTQGLDLSNDELAEVGYLLRM